MMLDVRCVLMHAEGEGEHSLSKPQSVSDEVLRSCGGCCIRNRVCHAHSQEGIICCWTQLLGSWESRRRLVL